MPYHLRPFLTCPGAKKQSAWYLSALLMGAAEAKWGQPDAFDIYTEPGCNSGAVGLDLIGKVGGDHISWRFSDPAPGVAAAWHYALHQPEVFSEAVRAEMARFDAPWMARGSSDFTYTEEQVAHFKAMRQRLTEVLFGGAVAVEDAARFVVFNHRAMNGIVRCGSGELPAGETLRSGRKAARCITTPPGKYAFAPSGSPQADRIREWASRPEVMRVEDWTYDEELEAARRSARGGKRVVVFIDPPYFEWKKRKPKKESKKDEERRIRAAEERAKLEATGVRVVGRKPGPREVVVGATEEWVPTFTAYTPPGFSLEMRERLRSAVVQLVEAGALVVCMDHWSSGWWWEETGVFSVLRGAGEEGVAVPVGGAGKGFYADVSSTTWVDSYTQVNPRGGDRAIRRDWLGVAGLRRGFHLPAKEWIAAFGEDPWLRKRV